MENQTISPPSGRHLENVEATITGWSRRHLQHWTPKTGRRVTSLQVAVNGQRRSLIQPKPQGRSADTSQHFPQAIRRWGNSLAVRLPADCLRQAGLQEGDEINIVVGPDGRLSLEPLRRLDRSALATDLRQLQATMPLTPAVIEDCRAGERW
jgi:antitoxin MazE